MNAKFLTFLVILASIVSLSPRSAEATSMHTSSLQFGTEIGNGLIKFSSAGDLTFANEGLAAPAAFLTDSYSLIACIEYSLVLDLPPVDRQALWSLCLGASLTGNVHGDPIDPISFNPPPLSLGTFSLADLGVVSQPDLSTFMLGEINMDNPFLFPPVGGIWLDDGGDPNVFGDADPFTGAIYLGLDLSEVTEGMAILDRMGMSWEGVQAAEFHIGGFVELKAVVPESGGTFALFQIGILGVAGLRLKRRRNRQAPARKA